MKKALQIKQGSYFTLRCEAPVNDDMWQALQPLAYQPCPKAQQDTIGWHSLNDEDHTILHQPCQGTMWLLACYEKRVLPTGAINQIHQQRIADIESTQAKLSAREKSALKEDIINDLLPQALTQRYFIPVIVNFNDGWLFIANRQASMVKRVRSLLGKTFLPWEVTPTPLAKNVPYILTQWLVNSPPDPFVLDKRCELYATRDRHSRISIRHTELELSEVQKCVTTGRQASYLGLNWRELCQFTLHDDASLAQMRWQRDDEPVNLDADTIIHYMTNSLCELYNDLFNHFGQVPIT